MILINEAVKNTSQCIFCGNAVDIDDKDLFENYVFKIAATFPGAMEL